MDRERLERALGSPAVSLRRLSGGCVAEVAGVELADGRRLVVKFGRPGSRLDLEGWMLRTLAGRSELPVPAVHHAEDSLLAMDWLADGGRLDAGAQAHAGRLVAALHGIEGEAFGCDRDTLLGGLPLANPWTASWREFFRDSRLLAMAEAARVEGLLPAAAMARVERLAGRLENWIEADLRPSLIHGDLWAGNVVVGPGSRVSGFVDPAVHYADPESEIAFTGMFGGLDRDFLGAYTEIRPLRPGFAEGRRDLYRLVPLLVHLRLFGGGWLPAVTETLARIGA